MRLLLHAIATSEAAAVPSAGVRGQPLIVVRHGELSAYASCFDAPAKPFGRADLLDHHDIISGLAAHLDTLLPARFPTWFADEQALRAELDRRQSDLLGALERVCGRVEIALTAMWTSAQHEDVAPPAAATPGRRYLLARQQAFGGTDRRRARAQALADQTERLVGSELVEVRHQVCPSVTVALSSALLVPRDNAEKIKARLAREEQDVRILVNGPWPPYTFANVV
jgi:gas vesicle protein GvpL/GvpF